MKRLRCLHSEAWKDNLKSALYYLPGAYNLLLLNCQKTLKEHGRELLASTQFPVRTEPSCQALVPESMVEEE